MNKFILQIENMEKDKLWRQERWGAKNEGKSRTHTCQSSLMKTIMIQFQTPSNTRVPLPFIDKHVT